MAESWIEIEDQPEIVDAEVEDFIQQLESEQQPMSDVEDDSEPEGVDSSDDEGEPLTFFKAEEMVHELKKNCFKLGIGEQGQRCLERFSRALVQAKLARPKRDVTLHNYFLSKSS